MDHSHADEDLGVVLAALLIFDVERPQTSLGRLEAATLAAVALRMVATSGRQRRPRTTSPAMASTSSAAAWSWLRRAICPRFARENPHSFWEAAGAFARRKGRAYTELQIALSPGACTQGAE